jgi:hypothetical protein
MHSILLVGLLMRDIQKVLWILQLQLCGHDGVHECRGCWFCGTAWTQFADNMFKKIQSPAKWEMQSVIHFLNAKNMKPTEIHRQLCDMYVEHAMSSSMVWRWVQLFNKGCENVHNDPHSGWPSVVKENLITTFGWEQFNHPPLQPRLSANWFSFVPAS